MIRERRRKVCGCLTNDSFIIYSTVSAKIHVTKPRVARRSHAGYPWVPFVSPAGDPPAIL